MDEEKEESSAPKLLLVEDHSGTGEALKRLLRRAGFNVRLAASVAEALEFAKGESFALVITDLRLSDGSGVDVLQQLRLTSKPRGIVLSGLFEEGDEERLAAVGADRIFTKPADWNLLLEAVSELTR
jgi:two-component system OmpR family response regulator